MGKMRIEPKVIQETPYLWVIDKPAGWLTIPGRGTAAPVVSEWAKRELGPIWIVHRLDRDTSGVLLFARSGEIHREANGWFQRHEITKSYDCLVQGNFAAPMKRIQRPVNGAASITQIEVREKRKEGSWIRARPLTGRRHQIRIHLAEEGHPIWGDSQYKGPMKITWTDGSPLDVDRVALHASTLLLPTGEKFDAPFPDDFKLWVETLQAKGSP